ncbi:MAG: hypothetical protein LH660_19510 [Phormidesmis sp. CAN_BIN36]|nr:hypothetical protein [Phormidesmis sp. CAN_BIN36]
MQIPQGSHYEIYDRPIAHLQSDRPSHPDPRSRNVCKTELPSAAIARSPVVKQDHRDRTTKAAIAIEMVRSHKDLQFEMKSYLKGRTLQDW